MEIIALHTKVKQKKSLPVARVKPSGLVRTEAVTPADHVIAGGKVSRIGTHA